MQVSAVGSTNFGNGYYTDMSRNDIEKAEQISQILRNSYNEEEPKKKGILGTASSIAIGLVGIFILTKKGLKGIEEFASSAGSAVQKVTKTVSEYANKIADKSTFIKDMSSKFNAFQKDNKVAQAAVKVVKTIDQKRGLAVDYISKLGKDKVNNIIAGATSIGTTAYVAHTDGNKNGIPDIAEKGVNAYKSAVRNMDTIKELVDLVS